MSLSQNKRWAIGAGIAVAIIAAALLVRPPQALAGDRLEPADLASCTIRGNLTVEIILDPKTGPANSNAWAGPIKDVDEVTLLEEWALITKRALGSDGTLIVPREKVVFINIVR